jgi:hypothetical protein
LRQLQGDSDSVILGSLAAGFFVFLATAFLLRLHAKWLEGTPTDPENSVGVPAFRAWLTLGNLFVAALLTFLGWLGFGIPFAVTLLLTCGALALKPLLNPTGRDPIISGSNNLSAEREKILSLLESGKITADESAELLNALGASTSTRNQPPVPLSSARRLALVGAAVVLVGFFLPWFSFSPTAELSRMMQQLPGMPGFSIPGAPNFPLMNNVLYVTGGDVGKGLGWMVLILAMVAALAPHLGLAWDRTTRRTMQMLALGIGSIILLYLMTQNVRLVRIGLVLALAGYIVEWVAIWREDALLVSHRLPREEGA